MTSRRARTDDAKADRRSDILKAAGYLFDSSELEQFTMDAVAAKLDLAKGTLYRYFPTRESLLLALLTDSFDEWFCSIDAAITGSIDPHQLEQILVESIVARPRFVRLNGMLSSILERNIPYEVAHDFKSRLLDSTTKTAATLRECAGIATEPAAIRFLVHFHAAIVGLHSCAHPAPIVELVLADERLSPLRLDFAAELAHVTRALIFSFLTAKGSS